MDVLIARGGEASRRSLARRFMELPWGQAAGPDRVVAGHPPVLEAVLARE